MSVSLISIIMATYNRAHYIHQAIESMLNQSYKHFEFIIINDGSTDETSQILMDYARQDSRIKILRHSNRGVAISRNRGLKSAQGEYIAMMDDDDLSLPTRLEKQLSFLKANLALSACVCYNYNMLDKEGKKLRKKKRKHSKLVMDKNSLKNRLALPFILAPMTLIKKEAFTACNGYRSTLTSAVDLDLTLRFQERFQAGVVPEFLYQYRAPDSQFGANISTHNLISALHCHIAAYISAWYRRNKNWDPLEEQAPADLLKLAPHLPLISRRRIVKTITPIIKKFKRIPHLPLEDMHEVIQIINQLNNRPFLKSRFKRRQLFPLIQEGRWQDLFALIRL